MNGGTGGQHDNYGSALTAQPGESQGRSVTNPNSRLMVHIGLPTLRAPDAPRPGWSHHTPGPVRPQPDDGGIKTIIPVTNPIESVFATVRHRTVRTKGALSQDTAKLMVFKLISAASRTWPRLQGEN